MNRPQFVQRVTKGGTNKWDEEGKEKLKQNVLSTFQPNTHTQWAPLLCIASVCSVSMNSGENHGHARNHIHTDRDTNRHGRSGDKEIIFDKINGEKIGANLYVVLCWLLLLFSFCCNATTYTRQLNCQWHTDRVCERETYTGCADAMKWNVKMGCEKGQWKRVLKDDEYCISLCVFFLCSASVSWTKSVALWIVRSIGMQCAFKRCHRGWLTSTFTIARDYRIIAQCTCFMLVPGAGWRAAQVFILQGNKGDDKTTSTTCLIRFESPRSSNVCARFSMKHSTNFRACGREHITHAISVYSSIALYWISLRSSMKLLCV